MTGIGVLLTLGTSWTTFQIIDSEFANRAVRWSTVETTALIALPLLAIGMGLIVGGISLARDN